MPNYPTMTDEDKKWRAEYDANTLAEAEMIKGDPERLEAAQKCAVEKAKVKEEEAENMKMVAHGKFSYSAMPKDE